MGNKAACRMSLTSEVVEAMLRSSTVAWDGRLVAKLRRLCKGFKALLDGHLPDIEYKPHFSATDGVRLRKLATAR